MTKKRFVDFLILLLTGYCLPLTCLLSGCGYTLQTRASLPFETISIGTIDNRTSEPKLQDKFHEVLAENFAQYGFRLSSGARYRLEGEIQRFDLLPTTEVNLTATQYQVAMKASFKLIDTESGKAIPILAPDSPFITYFNATGTIESIMTQKELAEVSFLQNLSQSMVSFIVYNTPKYFAYLLFKPEDIKDLGGLMQKLREAKDPLSQYLRDQFRADFLRQIDAYSEFDYSATALKISLVNELNNIIQAQDIFDEKRFAGIKLSDEALQLARQNAQGFNRVHLNRLLLEEAYPDELVKTKPATGNR